METGQEFLLEDMSHTARRGLDVLRRFRNEDSASREFVGSIVALLCSGAENAIVAVGCSPAVNPDLIARDIVRAMPVTDTSEGVAGAVLTFAAPPLVESPRAQLRVLHDRYLAAAGAVGPSYRHQPQYPVRLSVHRSTETEALIALLKTQKIRMVVITRAENMVDQRGTVAWRDRLFRHTADVAHRAGVPHVLIGERMSVLAVSSTAREVDRIKLVLQPLYDHASNDDVTKFAAILNGYQAALGDFADIVLAERTVRIMERTGGDPCRFAAWLCDATCEAARNAEKLSWNHLNRVGPHLTHINQATQDLANVRAWRVFESLDSPVSVVEKQKDRYTRANKPGVRSPSRDAVPRANVTTVA